MSEPDALARFEAMRPQLRRVAYRMLGSVADAEDAVQDAFLRWRSAVETEIRNPDAFLTRIVTRLCLDRLKSAKATRETYVGEWLPEPIVEDDPAEGEDVTLVLMLALERLSPLERAAFLLHDVFGLGFDEVAAALEREPAAVRQLAARARKNVREARPRFPVAPEAGLRIADAFFAASRQGDAASLAKVLAEDVVLYADGGGLRHAVLNPILGLQKVSAMFEGLARKPGAVSPTVLMRGLIDGLPGVVTREADGVLQTVSLRIEDGRITAIYVMRNPEKLRHLESRFAGKPAPR